MHLKDNVCACSCAETDVLDETLPEEILLDENAEASKHSFYMVGGFEVSPDHRLLAWAEDTVGGEKYTLHVKDMATGKRLLPEPIKVIWLPCFLACPVTGHVGVPLVIILHSTESVSLTDMSLQDTAGNVAWANDNKTLFYVTKDKLDRPYKVTSPSQTAAATLW